MSQPMYLHQLPGGDWGYFTYQGQTRLHLLHLGDCGQTAACAKAQGIKGWEFIPGDAGGRLWAEAWIRISRDAVREEVPAEQETT